MKQASSRRKFLKKSAAAAPLFMAASSKGAWASSTCASATGALSQSAGTFGGSVQCTPEFNTNSFSAGYSHGGYLQWPGHSGLGRWTPALKSGVKDEYIDNSGKLISGKNGISPSEVVANWSIYSDGSGAKLDDLVQVGLVQLPFALSSWGHVDVYEFIGTQLGWRMQVVTAMLSANTNTSFEYYGRVGEIVEIVNSYAGQTVPPIIINGVESSDGDYILDAYFSGLNTI